ncbi:MAG: hypothetical protein AB7U75_20640 [Hyphomicrobiaceae bacterium]
MSQNLIGCARRYALAAVRGLGSYVSSSEPLVRASNVLALLIASNQPIYPFYVRFVAGPDGGATFLTLITTPLFLAVPWFSRSSHRLGLASVPVIGLANAVIATLALGNAVGIDLFVIPCLAVAALVAERCNYKLVLAAALGALTAFLFVHFAGIEPMHRFADAAQSALYRLNAFAVAGLTIYIAIAFSRARWWAP